MWSLWGESYRICELCFVFFFGEQLVQKSRKAVWISTGVVVVGAFQVLLVAFCPTKTPMQWQYQDGNAQVMNMLIGVLVEVVSVTAQVDKEETAMKVVWSWVIESWDPVSTSHSHADGAREYLTPQNKVYIAV